MRTYNFELSQFKFLCDETIPVVKVLVLNAGSKNVRENDSWQFNIERLVIELALKLCS